MSGALHGLAGKLSGPAMPAALAESAELRRRSVTDELSRAELAKFLGTIAGEFDNDDESEEAAAIAYANEAVAEFQRLSPETFARYETDFGKAVQT